MSEKTGREKGWAGNVEYLSLWRWYGSRIQEYSPGVGSEGEWRWRGVMLNRSTNYQAAELMGHHKGRGIPLMGLRTRFCSCTEHLKASTALTAPAQAEAACWRQGWKWQEIMAEKEKITLDRGPRGPRDTGASQRPRLALATLLPARWHAGLGAQALWLFIVYSPCFPWVPSNRVNWVTELRQD